MSAPKTGAEIRQAFLSFFEAREHLALPSDSLIPTGDPTLLFTGAGMNQFKNEFLGKGRDLRRATTAQKCLRVPDLEKVGLTPRHHTFFEMLGNFSFGDYFKKETIAWEWQFFTEVMGWDGERFLVTVYQDDEEAYGLWREEIGLPAERIFRFGEKENYWPASAPSRGPNGPCGPCSEIYWDQSPGKPFPDNQGLEELPSRFLEVGNFVFTQFDRQSNGSLPPLPQSNIDVGLGLERIAAVAQGVDNNLETDIFAPVLEKIQSLSGCTYGKDAANDIRIRRIADHARAVFFCIADGAAPSREGRGYVVRKIIRRSLRDGIDLQMPEGFLTELLPSIQKTMGSAYPEILEHADLIRAMAGGEEEQFREVYQRGIQRLESMLAQLGNPEKGTVFPGDAAFELHDTFGFPVDITAVVVREHGFSLDEKGFERAMAQQKNRARASSGLSGDVFAESFGSRCASANIPETIFVGYDTLSHKGQVLGIFDDGEFIQEIPAGKSAAVLLDATPFYAEGGGQVGDQGQLKDGAGKVVFEINHTTAEGNFWLHHGTAKQSFAAGDSLTALVHAETRAAIQRHHTATHLLQSAFQEVVGTHVHQAGSKVEATRLRFDYTHGEALSPETLLQLEDWISTAILSATPVETRISSLDDARKQGVTALFGEKYAEEVRVVEVAQFSAELCGGTHVSNTGAIGLFRIVSDRALAAGVRRMEAVAGTAALHKVREERDSLSAAAGLLKCPPHQVAERVLALQAQAKLAKTALTTEIPDGEELLAQLQSPTQPSWQHLHGISADGLRQLADQLKGKRVPPLLLLTGGEGEQLPFVILCPPTSPWNAGEMAKKFGLFVGGGGGGRADFAQGQGAQNGDLKQATEDFFGSLPTPA